MRIIVGLGNPGPHYQNTRHNIGWLALDYWAPGALWREEKKFNALVHEKNGDLFVKPLSFMNNSGQVVQKIMNYYGWLPKKFGLIRSKGSNLNHCLIVIHDELDLEFGRWRLASDSSSAGHRGVESIINHLKTKKFTRIRLGIKNDLLKNPIPAEKFVLQPFSQNEREKLPDLFSSISPDQLS